MKISKGSYVSINGKTLRGSRNKGKWIEALHLLHVYSYEYGVVIGQLEYHKEKTQGETPINRELLSMLNIKNLIGTSDLKYFFSKLEALL